MNSRTVKTFYAKNKTAILAGGAVLVAYRVWGMISGLMGIVSSPLEDAAGAIAKAHAQASNGIAKQRVVAGIDPPRPTPSNPRPAVRVPTNQDIDRYRAAAAAIQTETAKMFPNLAIVYSVLKPFGKQLYGPHGLALVDRRGRPVLRALTGRYDHALAPFYSGPLQADLDKLFLNPPIWYTFPNRDRCEFYRKHIRV
jgi:hypothetical protein